MNDTSRTSHHLAVLRIHAGPCWGSGFLVSPLDVVTAAHVVKDVGAETLRIQSRAWMGDRAPIAVEVAEACDCALLRLSPAAPLQVPPIPLPHSEMVLASVGDTVELLGFAERDRDVDVHEGIISRFDGLANMLVVNADLPPGFSGGPVLVAGRLLGLGIAQRHAAGHGYVLPLHAFASFVLSKATGEVLQDVTAVHPLRRFPRGPGVATALTFAWLFLVLEYYMSRHAGDAGLLLIARTNALRLACDPDVKSNGLLQTHDLPSIHYSPINFWQMAFGQAGLRSPRLLAALLLADDNEEAMPAAVHEQRRVALAKLADWRGSSS